MKSDRRFKTAQGLNRSKDRVVELTNKQVFYGGYSLFHNFHLITWRRKKGKSIKKLDQLKHFNIKTQELASNVAINQKNEKQYVRPQSSIPETKGFFLDNVTPDINGFTDEPVVHQCDFQVVKNIFIDDSK